VSHPAPNVRNRPSVTSLVWSYDRYASQYAAFTRVQAPHEEIIEDLPTMMAVSFEGFVAGYSQLMCLFRQDALVEFGRKNRKILPTRILFFRDGVSEGEFAKVAEQEIKKIEGSSMTVLSSFCTEFLSAESITMVWNKLGITGKVARPTLTFVVVGKRCVLPAYSCLFKKLIIVLIDDQTSCSLFPQPVSLAPLVRRCQI
jgi:eukaryotic translation initiation factor 2C